MDYINKLRLAKSCIINDKFFARCRVVSDADVRVIFGQFFPIFQKLQSYKRMINNAYVNIEKNKQMIMVRVLERQDL